MKAALKMHILRVSSRTRETQRVGVKMDSNWVFFRTVYASDKYRFVSSRMQLIRYTHLTIYTYIHTFTKETKAIIRGL